MKKINFKYNISIAIFLCLLILPLSLMLAWAFINNWPWPELLPESFGLRGWRYFISPRSKSVEILFFSIGLSSTVALLTLLLTIPAAKALSHYNFKFKKQIEILFFLPIIVPSLTIAMGIHLQFLRFGLANTFLGVVLIHLIPCIPYSIRILKSVFSIVGRRIELQARNLGASPLQTFTHITFPLILPGIISAGSMVFIVSFSQYFLTMLIGGGRIITFSMVMFPYIESGDRMLSSVYSIVFVGVSLIFLFIVESIVKRFYASKLKGYNYV